MNTLEILHEYGTTTTKVAVNQNGEEHHSPCPFCGGDDRFVVQTGAREGAGSFWCRQCKKWGDNIQLVQDLYNLSFPAAKERLGLSTSHNPSYKPASRQVRQQPPKWQPQAKSYSSEVADLSLYREKLAKFMTTAHKALLETPKQLHFLEKRGISLESVKKWQLGWNPKTTYRPRTSWGLTSQVNPKTGQQKRIIIPAGIVIPWIVAGHVRRLQIRLAEIDPSQPKKRYHFVRGGAMDTFCTEFDADVYTIVETALDAIMIDDKACDLTAAVALASVAVKPTATVAKSLLAADRVLNALDYDHAGANEVAWWSDNFENSTRHPVPEGNDPGEAYELGVPIRDWIWCGLPASSKITDNGELLDAPPAKPSAPKRAKHPVKIAKVAQKPAIHPDIIALHKLLERYNVVIHKDQDGGVVIRNHGNCPSNDGKRLFDLVWNSNQVGDLIDNRRAGSISSGNILGGLR